MTAKELSKLCYLNQEIAQARQELTEVHRSTWKASAEEAAELTAKKKALQEKIRRRKEERDRLWAYIDAVEDAQIRRILDLRFAKRLSWAQVAFRMGGGNTADGVRMMCFRYLRDH